MPLFSRRVTFPCVIVLFKLSRKTGPMPHSWQPLPSTKICFQMMRKDMLAVPFLCTGLFGFFNPTKEEERGPKKEDFRIYLFSFLAIHLSNSLNITSVQLELSFSNRWLIKC